MILKDKWKDLTGYTMISYGILDLAVGDKTYWYLLFRDEAFSVIL